MHDGEMVAILKKLYVVFCKPLRVVFVATHRGLIITSEGALVDRPERR